MAGSIPKSMENKLAEGRGQGCMGKYTPWLFVHEVPSKGLVSRIKGWKTQRSHHLLSLNELYYFYLLEWNDEVIDIREQYPLLPLEETLSIAKELKIKHPFDTNNKEFNVVTTDFLISVKAGFGYTLTARAVKPWEDLADRRTREKLAIEEQYWLNRQIPWQIVTERNIHLTIAKNIGFIHHKYNPENLPIDKSMIPAIRNVLEKRIIRYPNLTLSNCCLEVDNTFHLAPGSSLAVVRHLLANKVWLTDMTSQINPDRPFLFKVRQ